jgi:signal transduction histidine kinase/CheY-like chemotaxis protein
MIALLIGFLFTLVFARALVAYLRRRDALMRDVMLVFAAISGLVVIDLYRRLIGPPPTLVADVLVVLILGQPYLTLRLMTRLRRVPKWLTRCALVAFLFSATPYLFINPPTPKLWTLTVVVVYASTGTVAAAFLAAEARRRSGSARVRLWCASVGTAMMALGLLVLGAGSAAPGITPVTTVTGRAFALAAAVAYLLAFMPPAVLRRQWAGGAAYRAARRLLYLEDQSPEAIWHRYADSVRGIAGADAVAVLAAGPDGTVEELTVAGLPRGSGEHRPLEDLDALLSAPQPVRVASTVDEHLPTIAVDYARRIGARYVRAIPLPLPAGRPAAVLLINEHRSLFVEDDAQVLADLGGHSGLLADRGAVNATRERLAAELSDSVAALAAVSQAKTDFLSTMSHELRTPLNAIVGFSDLMRAEKQANPNASVPADWIDNVFTSGQHLLRLINDVLDLAKVEAGRMELHPVDLALPAAVHEVTAALRPLIDRKRLHLVTTVPNLTLSADPVRFRQILDNLLSNAIKFTPEDGIITVAAAPVGGEVALSVSDTGMGIPPEDQEKIFDEFQQAGDESSRHAGTGLGLALTRRLVDAHGGRIEVTSAEGTGTRFTLHLPSGTPTAIDAPVSSPPPGRGGILIIEDDPPSASLLSTYLQSSGYEVSVASTGEAGLAQARERRPDAILLDIVLPGMNGWEVLRQINHDPGLNTVPVFIVTVVDEEMVERALRPTDFFVKPVDRSRLMARLAEHVLSAATETPAVLVVDDDRTSLDLMRAALERMGATVTTTDDPADGLRQAGSHHFDLIITDLVMPEVDGFTLVTSLNDDPVTRATPVLVLTAHDLTRSDRSRLDGKVIGVLPKGDGVQDELRSYLNLISRVSSERATTPDPLTEAARGVSGGLTR